MTMTNKPTSHDAPSLESLRSQLNDLDASMLELFQKRQALASEVWETKQEMDKPIHDPAQEETKIRRLLSDSPTPSTKAEENLFRTLFRLSRVKQYRLSVDQGHLTPLRRSLNRATNRTFEPKTLACQGTIDSYASQAAVKLYPDAHIFNIRSFEGAARQVYEGQVDAAVLPLENSTAGMVEDVYRLLEKFQLHITETLSMGIRHHLVALPEASMSSIKKVLSHPQALNQCSATIRGMGWDIESVNNTAFAAREVAHLQDPTLAAIASEKAAQTHGLNVLMAEMSNTYVNQTRFAVLTKEPVIRGDANRLALLLSLPHQPNALAQVLALFAELNINLTKIVSLPIPDRAWEYRFYLECEAKFADPNAQVLLHQLDSETTSLQFIGWYEEHPESGTAD